MKLGACQYPPSNCCGSRQIQQTFNALWQLMDGNVDSHNINMSGIFAGSIITGPPQGLPPQGGGPNIVRPTGGPGPQVVAYSIWDEGFPRVVEGCQEDDGSHNYAVILESGRKMILVEESNVEGVVCPSAGTLELTPGASDGTIDAPSGDLHLDASGFVVADTDLVPPAARSRGSHTFHSHTFASYAFHSYALHGSFYQMGQPNRQWPIGHFDDVRLSSRGSLRFYRSTDTGAGAYLSLRGINDTIYARTDDNINAAQVGAGALLGNVSPGGAPSSALGSDLSLLNAGAIRWGDSVPYTADDNIVSLPIVRAALERSAAGVLRITGGSVAGTTTALELVDGDALGTDEIAKIIPGELTADRTYTLPDKTMTFADDADVLKADGNETVTGDWGFEGKLGFFGATPAVQPSAYTPTNVTTTRSFDADSTTLAEVADVLGTLINDMQTLGAVG